MAADFTDRRSTAADTEPGFRITLAQLRAFLPRYKWVIAGVFVCTVLSAYAALNLMTELYDVHSSLLVKLGRENLDAPVTARNAVLSTGLRREELGSEIQILGSQELVAQVVDEIGVDAFRVTRVPPPDLLGKAKFYAKAVLRWAKAQGQDVLIALDLKKRLSERDAVLALLSEASTVEARKDSDVIVLTLRLADPQLAVRVQRTLIQKYLAHRVQVRQNTGVKEFFEREVSTLREALDAAERSVREWKEQRALTLPGEQKALLLRQIREVAAQRELAVSRGDALATQVAAARGLIGNTAERVRGSQVERPSADIQQLRERLTKLEGERVRLLTTYLATAAPVRTVEDEIATLRVLINATNSSEIGSVTTELNPLRQQLEQSVNQDTVALQGLSAEQAARDRQLARLSLELQRINEADATLTELERERSLVEQNYLTAAKRLTEAEVEAQLDVSRISNVTVATPPAATLVPVYPRKLLLMSLALAVGLVLGVGLAIAIEWTTDTVHDVEELESETELICLAAFAHERAAARGTARGAV